MVEKSTKKSDFEHFLGAKILKNGEFLEVKKGIFGVKIQKWDFLNIFFKHSVYFLESVTLVEFLRLMIEY